MSDYRTDRAKLTSFDVNWLCLYLVFLTIPVIEFAGLLASVAPSIPLGTAIVIELLAIVLTMNGCSRLAFAATSAVHGLTLCWSAVSCALLIFIAVANHRLIGCLYDIAGALPIFGVAIILYQLRKLSSAYERLQSFMVGAGGLLLGALGVHGMLMITAEKLHRLCDPVLYRFQYILGLTDIGPLHYAYSLPGLGTVFYDIYSYLNIFIVLAAASEFVHAKTPRQATLILQFLVVAAIGYGLYFLMPAVAPEPFFGASFPYHLPHFAMVADHFVRVPASVPADMPRNTMPSLHATWPILALLALRQSPLWHRALGVAFVGIILIVTLGAGQHYTVDWIAAFPLVLLARGISAVALPSNAPARRNAIMLGACLLSLWVVAVRGAPESLQDPTFIRLLALTSLLLPIWLERRLAKAEGHGNRSNRSRHRAPSSPEL